MNKISDYKNINDERTDTDEIATLKVNYKDVLDLKYLYLLMHEWLVEEGYAPSDDSAFEEIFYYQKEDPNAGNFYHFKWRFDKNPPNTSLWKYQLEVDTMVLTMKDVELAVKGKKVKAQKGEVEVSIKGLIKSDPNNKFDNKLLKPFKTYIFKKLLRKQSDHYADTLKTDLIRFQEAIKSYLKIETYLPEREYADFWRQAP